MSNILALEGERLDGLLHWALHRLRLLTKQTLASGRKRGPTGTMAGQRHPSRDSTSY